MGNTFSRKQSLRDRLINLENAVLKQEYELSELLNYSVFYSTLWFGAFFIPLFCYLAYLSEIHYIFCLCFAFLFLILWYFICEIIHNRRKEFKKRKLELLKEERKLLIEKCKNDVDFSITKSLIDKYENEESRNTFFNQIQKKKRSSVISVSDFVLGNDPSNLNALICTRCGVHNGLIDPKNDDFQFYYCFNCKHKNIRKIVNASSLSPTLNSQSNNAVPK